MLPYWTGIATLTAAALAALLSGISLFLTGRREDKRWKREVLVETMVSFFEASYAYVDRAAFRAARDQLNKAVHQRTSTVLGSTTKRRDRQIGLDERSRPTDSEDFRFESLDVRQCLPLASSQSPAQLGCQTRQNSPLTATQFSSAEQGRGL